jgi:hypothetical protein
MLVFLASCTEEQAQPFTPPVLPIPAAATATIAATKAATASVAEDREELEVEEPEPAAGACEKRAAWTALPRCAHAGHVFAVGSVSGVRDLGLARAAAADRARRALFGRAEGDASDTEVLEFVRCGKTAFAIARAPAKSVAKEQTACDRGKLETHAPAAEGCPKWTVGVVTRDGDRLVAVGVARIRNPALAEATATNRARAELSRLTKNDGGFSELGRKKAFCGGNTFVELTAKSLDH